MWRFGCIVSHEGMLNQSHLNYKGSHYNVMVEWETGETNTNPLSFIEAYEPVACSLYDDEICFKNRKNGNDSNQ